MVAFLTFSVCSIFNLLCFSILNLYLFLQANRWKKRGMSVVPLAWLLEVNAQYPVLVTIFQSDGSIVINHGGIEMGQGINTKVR